MKNVSILLYPFFIALLLIQSSAFSQSQSKGTNLCIEGDKHCTFVLLSETNNQLHIINEARAKTALSPFSTFKITNSVIALEQGVVNDSKQVLTYDKNKYPTQAWWPPVWKLPSYNLGSAFKYSVVPVFRQMATDIGQQNMKVSLERLNYGNQDISSGLDDFWLNGSLKISSVEQIDFLQKLYQNQFNLTSVTLSTIKEIMLVETTGKYKLYGKTGAGKVDDKTMLGWYVGFVENDKGVHYFAFNFNRDSYAQMKAERVSTVINHLKVAGII